MDNNLMILESEREQAKIRLENALMTNRNILDNIERKLKTDEGKGLYISDGLQGNAMSVDTCLIQLVAYDRAIELYKRGINKYEG